MLMDSSLLSNNDTPSFPLNQSDESDENLSSNTLGPIEGDADVAGVAGVRNGDVSLAPSVPDTISDKLSTGVIGDDRPFFEFIPMIDDQDADHALQHDDNELHFQLQKERFLAKREIAQDTKPKRTSAPIKPTKSAAGNNPTKKVPVKAITEKLATCVMSSTKASRKKKVVFGTQSGTREDKEADVPTSSRSCPPISMRNRRVNFRNVGLLKANMPGVAVKPKRQTVTDEMFLSLQSRLAHEVARNKDLNLELERCQGHMRQAAEAYEDLGKLAIIERERADRTETKLKEALLRVRELELVLDSERKQRSLVNCCDAAITSFVGDEIPLVGGESLENIEASLKNVLSEIARFRQRRTNENNRDLENQSPITRQKAVYSPPKSANPNHITKSRQPEASYSAGRNRVTTGVMLVANSEDDRSQELRRALQHLISKRAGGPFRP